MKRNLLSTAIAAAFSFTLVSDVRADEFRWIWDKDTGGVNMDGGVIKDVQATFNIVTKSFTYVANFDKNSHGQLTEGFWLAVSGGPNPKGHAGELALLYFDATTFLKGGDATLTAYAYNGVNGANSYRDGSPSSGTQNPDKIDSSLLGKTWIKELSVTNEANGTRTMKIDIDATKINGHTPAYPGPGGPSEWTGVAFGEKIGVWFHPVVGLQSKYEDGFLDTDNGFDFKKSGWLDLQNKQTEVVPEPATMIALGAGLAAFARRKRA